MKFKFEEYFMVKLLKNAAIGVGSTAAIFTALPIFGAVGVLSAGGAALGGVIGVAAAVADKIRGE